MTAHATSIQSERGRYAVVREDAIAMTTRDGTVLRADIYRPESEETFPVLVRRTPYGKQLNDLSAAFNEAHYFASHGYIVVVQDTRGRFSSEGRWYPFIYEAHDGYDTIEWAARLPGANGKVGTFGQSYGAISQYLAAAQRPPHLKTCVPVSAYQLNFENYWYNSGALELGWMLSYFVNMAESVFAGVGNESALAEIASFKADPATRFSRLTDSALMHLPITDWIDRLGEGAPFLKDILNHSTDGPYWWATDLSRQLQNIDVAMLHVGSWYDIANRDTPRFFTGLGREALTPEARSNQALIMGPWAHQLPFSQPTSGGTGDIDFGPEAAVSLVDIQRNWFDHYLKSERDGLPRPPVSIFVMGDNIWRDEVEWPLSRAEHTPYYLHSAGDANTLNGGGTLTTEHPGNEPSDRFCYDPEHPVPSTGGRMIGGGVADQRDNQSRSDVLVFTSVELDEELEITGPVIVELHASTTAEDTDFVAVLSDVRPDGYAQNLAEGIVRARFRESYETPTAIKPNEVYSFRINLWNISHVFATGHRLRLHVTSSDFPRWDRNTGTADASGTAALLSSVDQTVFHDRMRPSHVLLPVIPR
ncbi:MULTISPECIES: CocE/NonD family hydrolase [unclassified Rhodococcus (in: high G+C Gram-positive bacteria)]|uniref:CocE/NonD family hydrolase n=1 Tax=unclassified Rhodococcus (in: high G+C Gram-positive bacteria) TaxID=192944 RepID=UPI00163A8AA9|nr:MULTISPECIES: CocE/NonD family hydrolase [unclassified Rhodococcus (in: high G+C Gram-positive bacteria)]MBC2637916.1 CocE/NonD family hydrolase [Rhodococcus sp. 3A]MBC2897336.1 CocE/NonD family hydrolase [Rhodococcus sp. 4CII]